MMQKAAGDRERAGPGEKDLAQPIIIALIAAIAPHVATLPLWINLWCLVMWGYMLIRLRTGWPLPTARIRYALTFGGIIGLFVFFKGRIAADGFVGLMALMAAIKPFEMPTHRHRMITILLTYFITITALFRSDALVTVIYMFFSVFVTTTALVRINAPARTLGQSRKLAGTILAQALPLMVLLFLVFPRLPDAMFGFQDPSRGKSGFSETLAPGRISAMAMDTSPAFRASFDADLPPAHRLYWRGIVFTAFDGTAWHPAPPKEFRPAPAREISGDSITQTILLAPHNSHWLMGLDRPVKGPSWAFLERDGSLKSRKKITKKTQYTVYSQIREMGARPMDPALEDHAHAMRERIISRGGPGNPRTLALARQIGAAPGTAEEKAGRFLAYFRSNPFVYTLTPPGLGRRPLDRFIFETRKGYCEHYASAFAFMLNGAGIPARVVGGYLGGEVNPFGSYLIVRQSYAHAWVEFFDPAQGWARLDPTGAVSPERLYTHPDGSSSGIARGAGSLSMLTQIKFALDAVNLQWESWFTGYSYLEQKAWLAALGLIRGKRTAAGPVLAVLTGLGMAVFFSLLAWRFRRTGPNADPVALAMKIFYKKTESIGLSPQPGQGPNSFKVMCMEKRPDLAGEIQEIMDLYIDLRYKGPQSRTPPLQLKTRVKRFNPARKKES